MSDFSRDELKALAEEQIPPCISIYMQAEPRATLRQDNALRFKALLQQAEERLASMNVDNKDIKSMLAPGWSLVDDIGFWQAPSEGYAFFFSASPDAFRFYSDNSRAIQFEEMVIIGKSFYIQPLLPLLTGDGQYYVLALSKHHVGLLKGTRDTIQPVPIPGVPENINEALGEEVPESEIQGRPQNMSGGETTGVFSSYDREGYEKDRTMRFFRAVNQGIHKILAGQNVPLIIAGTQNLHPIYREANTYVNLLDEGIEHDADLLPAQELHTRSWAIVEPYFRQAREQAAERYHISAARGQASSKLEDVVPAAHYSRVESLFLAEGKHVYGSFDPQGNRIDLHGDQGPDSSDLIDEAAAQTVLNGGTVYVVPQDQMPDPHGPISAVFRY